MIKFKIHNTYGNKKEVFNWLSDIPISVDQNNSCEVRFKSDRKKYYNHKI